MEVAIPPKKNRKTQRHYDKALYKLRHLVENTFLHLKRWRGFVKNNFLQQSQTFKHSISDFKRDKNCNHKSGRYVKRIAFVFDGIF
ncbi:hypothetical protein NSMM_420005 [Nitrosomonas mobilis]|uniref:Transposase n=1 Tax=Nitrosomonas mobilis TaxID=51642 RepID=A0A1G5SFV5_9PROT|nr:hypothetical protein NSMM_420005 [Nitrosomonas mobilis]